MTDDNKPPMFGPSSPGCMGKVEAHTDRVATCSADLVLTIDDSDQS